MIPLSFIRLAVAVSITVSLVHAEEAKPLSLTVPKGDKFTLKVPANWKHNLVQPTPDLPPTVKIETVSGGVGLLITFLPDPAHKFTAKEDVDRAVTNLNKQYVGGSVEKETKLVQIESKNGHGSYAIFTDAEVAAAPAPKAGQFLKVTSGLFVFGKQAAAFTLMSGDTTSPDYKEAIKVLVEGITVP